MTDRECTDRQPRLFISYRSDDAGPTASRLYAELAECFGAEHIFLDHEQIEGGADWSDRLRKEVERATVMLVLIGEHWLTAQDAETGERRLSLPEDWVRQEIETALRVGTRVIPLLIEGARPPSERALRTVPTLVPVAERQALPLRRKDWGADLARLTHLLVTLGFPPDAGTADGGHGRLSVAMVVDRVAPYRTIASGRPVAYGTATLSDGTTAYGEGLHAQLTLENRSSFDIVVQLVELVVQSHDEHPLEPIEYPALSASAPHLELPATTRPDPLELTDLDVPGSAVPVLQKRLLLRAVGSAESQHTISFPVVARSSGIWRVHPRAVFVDAAGLREPLVVESQSLCIVKR